MFQGGGGVFREEIILRRIFSLFIFHEEKYFIPLEGEFLIAPSGNSNHAKEKYKTSKATDAIDRSILSLKAIASLGTVGDSVDSYCQWSRQ